MVVQDLLKVVKLYVRAEQEHFLFSLNNRVHTYSDLQRQNDWKPLGAFIQIEHLIFITSASHFRSDFQ